MHDQPALELPSASEQVLEDARVNFQVHWEHLHRAFELAIFELLAQECSCVDRVVVSYDGAFGCVEVDFYTRGQELDFVPSERLSELLAEAHGYLNFSICPGEFCAR